MLFWVVLCDCVWSVRCVSLMYVCQVIDPTVFLRIQYSVSILTYVCTPNV